ncbi:unnamed protein product [Spirodela intermedia]|uniref:Uncharacterized protein n=1 Tax=Spirodela intermedia TaxID=51605 RepID=A0A7I8IBP5_SPIIN|nr:unnamed protein product [Spirodela intermedia]CAA6654753.1 unnamed protein product [Spirodela intermedia]
MYFVRSCCKRLCAMSMADLLS